MKCFVLLFICVIDYLSVQAGRQPIKSKEIVSIVVDSINYEQDKGFLEEGAVKKISCKGSHKFQKLEWYDPSGNLVKHEPSDRVYVQEHVAPSLKSRTPVLVLTFTSIQVSDSGVWECRAGDLTQELQLCVLDPAEFVDTPDEYSLDEGRSISLSCQIRGNPEPKIQWYRNGELLSDESNNIFTSIKYNTQGYEGFVTIKSLTPEDAGSYICEAVQEMPHVDSCGYSNTLNVTLNVNSRPSFDEPDIEHIITKTNETVRLVCDPTAYPTPKFRWFHEVKDGLLKEISGDFVQVSDDETQSVLTLVANDTTFGQRYRCMAENRYGDTSKTFEIMKLIRPIKPDEVIVIDISLNTFVFNITWNVSYTYFPVDAIEIQYFAKQGTGTPRESQWKEAAVAIFDRIADEPSADSDSEDTSMPALLSDLEPDTEYWIRLRAINEMGESPWSAPILDRTLEIPVEKADFFVILLGFFLTAAIVAFAAICITIIKRT